MAKTYTNSIQPDRLTVDVPPRFTCQDGSILIEIETGAEPVALSMSPAMFLHTINIAVHFVNQNLGKVLSRILC